MGSRMMQFMEPRRLAQPPSFSAIGENLFHSSLPQFPQAWDESVFCLTLSGMMSGGRVMSLGHQGPERWWHGLSGESCCGWRRGNGRNPSLHEVGMVSCRLELGGVKVVLFLPRLYCCSIDLMSFSLSLGLSAWEVFNKYLDNWTTGWLKIALSGLQL